MRWTVLLLCLSVCGCRDPEPTYPPPTGDDCAASCDVLAHFGCAEGNSLCEPRCRQLSALGYLWTDESSGPKCVRHAGTIDAVRACNVRCEL